VRRYEQNCESRVVDADNIGAFYRFVNVRLGNKTGISPLHDASGNIVLDDCSKADLLNNSIIPSVINAVELRDLYMCKRVQIP